MQQNLKLWDKQNLIDACLFIHPTCLLVTNIVIEENTSKRIHIWKFSSRADQLDDQSQLRSLGSSDLRLDCLVNYPNMRPTLTVPVSSCPLQALKVRVHSVNYSRQ